MKIKNFIIFLLVASALIFGINVATTIFDIIWGIVAIILLVIGILGLIEGVTKKHDKCATILGSLILIAISILMFSLLAK